jgi:hypothetical protein
MKITDTRMFQTLFFALIFACLALLMLAGQAASAMAPRPTVLQMATEADRPYACDGGYVAGFVTEAGFTDSGVLRQGEMFAMNGGYVVSNAEHYAVSKTLIELIKAGPKAFDAAREGVPTTDQSALAADVRAKGQVREAAAVANTAAAMAVQFERWRPCLSLTGYQKLRSAAAAAKRAYDDARSDVVTAKWKYEYANRVAGTTR